LSASVTYAENWTQMGAVPANEAEAQAKTERGDKRAREIAKLVLEGERSRDRVSFGARACGATLGFLFGFIGRRFLGKLFVADSRCSNCGLCARTCPAGAILLGGGAKARPFWRMNCENCNRCINICPKVAINSSPLNAVLAIASITLFVVLGIAGVNQLVWPILAPSLGGWTGSLVHALLIAATVIAAHFASMGPADYFLFRWLRRIPGLSWAFGLSYSRGFRRYLAPGFKPERDGPGELK
jgi:ferredoxin